MKAALHFGINHYDPDYYGEGNDLKMCVQDAQVMQGISRHYDFTESLLIQNSTATRAMWLRTVGDYAKRLRRGDLLLLTQSSHGTYQDTNAKRATGVCMADGVLWDYEVRGVFEQFRVGVIIVWMTDCCFAESNWRWIRPPVAGNVYRSRFMPLQRQIKITPTQGDKRRIPATFFAYSSSNAYQESYEDENGGVYTQAINQALLQWPNLTYYQLHQRASKIIAEELSYPQTPILETIRANSFTASPFLSAIKTSTAQ